MRLRLPATALTLAILALPAGASATTATQHLTAGEQLVTNLGLTAWPGQGTINAYDADGANAGVTWGMPGVAAGWSNDTKCARFVRELFRRSYGWATDAWFTQELGSTSPDTDELVANMPSAADTRRLDGSGTSVTEYSGAGYGWMVLYANTSDGTVYGWRWGVNESAISKVSDGHAAMIARATVEA